MSAPEIRFLACADGRRVAFSVQGTGPVLLCPAWWVSHLQRDRQDPAFAAFFDRLGAGMTLVMHDAPTTGLSDRSGPPATLSTAADILTRLAAELGAARYSLFAMSFAGPAALHHAAGNPAVSRIVFFGSLATGSALGPPEVRAAFAALVRAHWGRGARALADLMIPGADPQAVAALARLMRASATPEAAAAILDAAGAIDTLADAARVSADCLVMHRAGDRAVPLDAGRALAAALPRARFMPVEGEAHPAWAGGLAAVEAANAFLHGGTPVVASEGCRFDAADRCLYADGRRLPLTPLETGVLSVLVTARGHLVTRDRLLAEVWKQPYEGSNRIDVAISALRRKLGPWAASIATVTGHGYRFDGWRTSPDA